MTSKQEFLLELESWIRDNLGRLIKESDFIMCEEYLSKENIKKRYDI